MSFEIKQGPGPGICEVVFRGEIDSFTYWQAVEACLAETDGQMEGLVLNLQDATTTMTTREEFMLGKRLSTEPQLFRMRTAFLNNSYSTRQDLIYLSATNRGLLAKRFTERQEAYKWTHRSAHVGASPAPLT